MNVVVTFAILAHSVNEKLKEDFFSMCVSEKKTKTFL